MLQVRSDYSRKALRDIPYRFRHQIAIIGDAGTGTSTLLKKLKAQFADLPYRFVSGGDIARATASSMGITIEQLVELSITDRKYDMARDNMIAMFAFQDWMVGEARIAHISMPYAWKVKLLCDPLACAERIRFDPARSTREFPGMNVEQIMAKQQERNKKDWDRYQALYPGCNWPDDDFDCVLDTTRLLVPDVVEKVVERYRLWVDSTTRDLFFPSTEIPYSLRPQR